MAVVPSLIEPQQDPSSSFCNIYMHTLRSQMVESAYMVGTCCPRSGYPEKSTAFLPTTIVDTCRWLQLQLCSFLPCSSEATAGKFPLPTSTGPPHVSMCSLAVGSPQHVDHINSLNYATCLPHTCREAMLPMTACVAASTSGENHSSCAGAVTSTG